MKPEFYDYLHQLRMPNALQERVERFYDLYSSLIDEELIGIFVTDRITQDGGRDFENVWFFTETYVMEAKSFVSKDEFDMVAYKDSVAGWKVTKETYDFEEATEASRMFIRLRFMNGLNGDLTATQNNCDYLKEILVRFFVPNVYVSQRAE